ncbi:hypothetical protein V6N13_123130 [Hibiscus sabdariffa]
MALVQLLNPGNKVSNGVKKPIEKEGDSDEKRVALTLHDGFLVTEMLRGSKRVGFAAGPGLIFQYISIRRKRQKGTTDKKGLRRL